jgi:hypothetical protein
LVALIAGTGRFIQHYAQGSEVWDPVPVPVFVASALFGLVVVAVYARAIGQAFLESHDQITANQLWIGFGLISGVLALAYLAGAIGIGR